jgi:hypothetical protein
MFQRLWSEMARDKRERDSFYDELHPSVPELEAQHARFGGIKARPNGFRLVQPPSHGPDNTVRLPSARS